MLSLGDLIKMQVHFNRSGMQVHSIGLEWCLRICISNKSQILLMMLVHGLLIEKCLMVHELMLSHELFMNDERRTKIENTHLETSVDICH